MMMLGHNHEYDPYKIPPSFQIAKQHQKARNVGQQIQSHFNISEPCPCCLYPTDKEEIPMCTPTKDLGQALGEAYPLYLQFMKYSLCTAMIFLIVSGYYSIQVFKGHDSCDSVFIYDE